MDGRNDRVVVNGTLAASVCRSKVFGHDSRSQYKADAD
jgi:hypothetical protein